jgi:hypothetical protein
LTAITGAAAAAAAAAAALLLPLLQVYRRKVPPFDSTIQPHLASLPALPSPLPLLLTPGPGQHQPHTPTQTAATSKHLLGQGGGGYCCHHCCCHFSRVSIGLCCLHRAPQQRTKVFGSAGKGGVVHCCWHLVLVSTSL